MARYKITPVLKQEFNGKPDRPYNLSPELFSLAKDDVRTLPSNLIYQITENNKIRLAVKFKKGKKNDAINFLNSNFPPPPVSLYSTRSHVDNVFTIGESSIDLFLPINELDVFNSYKANGIFISIRPLYPPIMNSGVITSQGDKTQRSDIVRDAFRINLNGECLPVNGFGIKIGVISDSFNTQIYTKFQNSQIDRNKSKAEVDVNNGDLPGNSNPNNHKTEVQIIRENEYQATDEGRAMLQIIHDVAPGAELAFFSASSPEDLKMGIQSLKKEGCTIIVDDLTFIQESFFYKSEISKDINDFTSNSENFYFTSAGNFGNFGYQDIFKCSESKPELSFLKLKNDTRAHVFGTDLKKDIFQKIKFEREGIYMIVLQWDESNCSEKDFSDLDIYLVDDDGKLLIGNNRFNQYGDAMEYLVFHATSKTSANILITSATGCPSKDLPFRYIVFQHNNGFSYDHMKERKTPTVSGHAMASKAITVGAVEIINSNENKIRNYSSYGGSINNNNPIEIDFVAPDGGNTNVALMGPDTDKDKFPNFYGTSSSAPHAAGAFALMKSALKHYNSEDLIFNAPPGINKMADKILHLFKQTCNSTGLGSNEIAGAGLLDTKNAFKKLLDQNPILKNSIVNNNENPCEEKNNKIVLNITADDISREYGQKLNLTDYTIDGIPQGETLVSLGFPKVKLKTTADFHLPYPDVNNYIITPYFAYDLSKDLLDKFQINFINGHLEITIKDLLIKPVDTSFKKDEPLLFNFNYEYNDNGIEDNELFLATIKQEHNATFYSNSNIVVRINRFKPLDINLRNILNNSSWITTEDNMQNTERQPDNSRNTVINEEFEVLKEYLNFLNGNGIDSAITNKYRPIVNKYRPIVNKYRPIVNKYRPIVNKYRPIVNKYRPIVNLSSSQVENEFIHNTIHLILEDGFFENMNKNASTEYFSINLITNSNGDGGSLIYPGSFFAPMSINFDITYLPGIIHK